MANWKRLWRLVWLNVFGIVAYFVLADFTKDRVVSAISVRLRTALGLSFDPGPFVEQWVSFAFLTAYCIVIVPGILIWVSEFKVEPQDNLGRWAAGLKPKPVQERLGEWGRGPRKWHHNPRKRSQTGVWISLWLTMNLAMAIAVVFTGVLGIGS